MEFVERLWEEAQNSLLVTKNCKEITDAFTDPRDGKTYKTIKIGDKIWMAENLAYDNVDHYYPNDNEADAEKYGYLYTWENAKLACPPGWRLPTKAEFNELLEYVDNNKSSSSDSFLPLIAKSAAWKDEYKNKGLDEFGFAALPAGAYYAGDYNLLVTSVASGRLRRTIVPMPIICSWAMAVPLSVMIARPVAVQFVV